MMADCVSVARGNATPARTLPRCARTQRDSPGTFSGAGVMSGLSGELPSGTR